MNNKEDSINFKNNALSACDLIIVKQVKENLVPSIQTALQSFNLSDDQKRIVCAHLPFDVCYCLSRELRKLYFTM